MSEALPDYSNGAVQNRDATGACLNPAGVVNAYCPPATFTSTCPLTALPNDCTGKIVPGQINGIVSELMCFAATINPDGNWDCGSLCNLAANFQAWAAENKLVDGVTIQGAGTLADPWRVDPEETVNKICATPNAKTDLAACVISGQAGNQLQVSGTDGLLYVPINPVAIVAAICASDAAGDALSGCLLSTDAGNQSTLGSDGRIFTPAQTPVVIASEICSDSNARDILRECLADTAPVAPACAVPAQFVGRDAGGTELLFASDASVGHGRISGVAQSPPNFDLTQAPGVYTYFTSNVSAFTNTNSCRNENESITYFAMLNILTVGDGNVQIVTEVSNDGAAFQTSDGQILRHTNSNPVELREEEFALTASADRFTAPLGSGTVQMRITVTIITPFGAGSRIVGGVGTITSRGNFIQQ